MNYYKMSLWICIIAIEFLALMPNGVKLIDNKFNASGAIEHVLAFVVLYALVHLAYKKLSIVQKILLLLLFAIQLELVQYFVPSRSVNIWDIVADMSGVMLVFLLWFVGKYLIRFKTKTIKL